MLSFCLSFIFNFENLEVVASSSALLLCEIHLHHSSSFKKPLQPQSSQHQIHQPFPLQFGTLDISGRINILTNRLGLWYDYAPLITSLIREGFSPLTIEETTSVKQNRLIVGT